jgi:hypothetical protein
MWSKYVGNMAEKFDWLHSKRNSNGRIKKLCANRRCQAEERRHDVGEGGDDWQYDCGGGRNRDGT